VVDSIVFAQYALCLIPEIFNTVNVVLSVGKQLAVVDAMVGKSRSHPTHHSCSSSPYR